MCDDSGAHECAVDPSLDLEGYVHGVLGWGWGMPVGERWQAVGGLLQAMSLALDELRSCASEYLEQGRKAKADAAAQVMRVHFVCWFFVHTCLQQSCE